MCSQALAGPENIKECLLHETQTNKSNKSNKARIFFGGISHATDNEGQFDGLHGLVEVTSVTLLV